MVHSEINPGTGNGMIILKPNNSASWHSNMMLLASLAMLALVISTFFLMQGLWLIMPFSGLEVLALFSCLYLCARANIKAEVITFTSDKVVIERGRIFAEKSWEYHRSRTKIFVKRPKLEDHPPKIVICSHGRETELGLFLNSDDKTMLVKKLRKIIYG